MPVTLLLTGLLVAASVTAFVLDTSGRRGLGQAMSTGFDSVVVQQRWFSTLTTVFFGPNPAALVLFVVAFLVGLGWAERLMGRWRLIIVFLTVTVTGTLVSFLLMAAGVAVRLYAADATRAERVLDPGLAVAGVVMAATAFAPIRTRRRVRIIGFSVLSVFALYAGQPVDVYRLFAGAAGLVFGMLLCRRGPRTHATRSERRTLLAAVVAVTALGPVISMVAPTSHGVLNPLGLLFRNPSRDFAAMAAQCVTGDLSARCVHAIELARLDGPAALLTTVLPLVALLVAARGIQKGRRVSLWAAVSLNLVFAALTVLFYTVTPLWSGEANSFQDQAVDNYAPFIVASVLVPCAIAAMLVAGRRLVDPDARPWPVARLFISVAALFTLCSTLYLGVAAATLSSFTPGTGFADVVANLPERFVPVSFLVYEPVATSATGVAAVVGDWVGPVFWSGVIVLILRSRRLPDPARAAGLERARAAVQRGADSLSWMSLWRGHRYWVGEDGVAIAYRVINDIAITTGSPLGAERDGDASAEFARFCDDRGWTPVFYCVADPYASALRDRGWAVTRIAEESVLHPAEWTVAGKRMQDIRTSINRARRAGIRAEWAGWENLSSVSQRQIAEISELWAAEKTLPEMRFTLGGQEEMTHEGVRLMVALDQDDRVLAVTSWLPRFRDDTVVGWTLDVMRRHPESPNGVMEFLIAETVLRAQSDRIETVSLSAAPLAQSTRNDPGPTDTTSATLGFVAKSLEPFYGFQSLFAFKSKFQPALRELYLCYPEKHQLPTIGMALARAYLPDVTPWQALRFLTTAVRSSRRSRPRRTLAARS
ncbi:membrane protein [Cnuibacter physcomitrellae]|nr:DUF2156 domain-containing protein [Cnuibacter physcomitrellae]GGI42834.1 membrane protein [Cnuibacter physcomitrellae]